VAWCDDQMKRTFESLVADDPPLPFAEDAFDLVSSRHPAVVHWTERLRLEYFDVGAMVFFLCKVIWTVPGFTVDRDRDRLRDLHQQIERAGVFRSSTSRTLFEMRKPTR